MSYYISSWKTDYEAPRPFRPQEPPRFPQPRRRPLEKLLRAIPWGDFRPTLAKLAEKDRKSPAGRKPFDLLLMLKLLILQRLYNLSDHQVEFQVKDRLSFQRFLGLRMEDSIPDEKTAWAFRERLSEAGLEKVLFSQFEKILQKRGLKTKE